MFQKNAIIGRTVWVSEKDVSLFISFWLWVMGKTYGRWLFSGYLQYEFFRINDGGIGVKIWQLSTFWIEGQNIANSVSTNFSFPVQYKADQKQNMIFSVFSVAWPCWMDEKIQI